MCVPHPLGDGWAHLEQHVHRQRGCLTEWDSHPHPVRLLGCNGHVHRQPHGDALLFGHWDAIVIAQWDALFFPIRYVQLHTQLQSYWDSLPFNYEHAQLQSHWDA